MCQVSYLFPEKQQVYSTYSKILSCSVYALSSGNLNKKPSNLQILKRK